MQRPLLVASCITAIVLQSGCETLSFLATPANALPERTFQYLCVGMKSEEVQITLGKKPTFVSKRLGKYPTLMCWEADNISLWAEFSDTGTLTNASLVNTTFDSPAYVRLSNGDKCSLPRRIPPAPPSADPISEANFERIHASMAEEEVEAILGRKADRGVWCGMSATHWSQWFGNNTSITVELEITFSDEGLSPPKVKEARFYNTNMWRIWRPDEAPPTSANDKP